MCVANVDCVEALRGLPLRDMIVVAGAGLSAPGCCMTGELVKALVAACRCPQPTDWNRLDAFYQIAHDTDPLQYYATLRQKFSPPFVADPRIYTLLAAVEFRAYITWDYDDLFPQAMLKSRGSLDGQFTYYPQQHMFFPYDLHSQRLVASHGFADANTPEWERKLVLKTSDYETAYTLNRNVDGTGGLLGWWCQILSTVSCLFIGTSLNEAGISSAIDYLIKDSNAPFRGQQHVCLSPLTIDFAKDQHAPALDPLFKAIRALPYHPEDERHRGLLRVWQEVTGIPDPQIPVRRLTVPKLRFGGI
jgi:hypothetical protein